MAQAQVRTLPGLRWWICGLLFLATTINYLDRQTLGVLQPLLRDAFGWNDADYGWVNFAFTAAYAIMFVLAGRIIDTIGTRIGFSIFVVLWSMASIAHAFTRNIMAFAIARFSLGITEAGNFPACLKTVAEWFPQKERALATGLFNSGSNAGIIFALLAVWVAKIWGWQSVFTITGLLGFVWLILWMILYRPLLQHPRLSDKEREYILSGQPKVQMGRSVRWTTLLRYKQTWAFLFGKFLTDPVWWFYLYWLPTFLKTTRGISLTHSAMLIIIPYLAADLGAVAGGWLSGHLSKRGWPIGKARVLVMGVAAIGMMGALVAVQAQALWLALAMISLATASHHAWMANLFANATDMFPQRLTGSVIGLGGSCGAIGGMLMTLLVGGTLQWTGSYVPIFVWAGLMHPLAFVLFLALAGLKLPTADITDDADSRSSRRMAASGAVTCLAGALAGSFVIFRWQSLVDATHSLSAPAGGLTTAIGVVLIGLVLLYASRARKLKIAPAAPDSQADAYAGALDETRD